MTTWFEKYQKLDRLVDKFIHDETYQWEIKSAKKREKRRREIKEYRFCEIVIIGGRNVLLLGLGGFIYYFALYSYKTLKFILCPVILRKGE